ncbi:MAG: hypothetical protein KF829_10625 [Ferruginibacter sp.]|nr:hypothetical protein [Ferruginibacter sp.]
MEKSFTVHPIWDALKTFINKFLQNPSIYPIDYYKKLRYNRKRRPYNY